MNMHVLQGNALPRIGLGTWRLGESPARFESEVDAVTLALRLGYRAVDTAEMYGEGGAERVVGEALRRARAEGIARESVFVVSKAYPHHGAPADLLRACRASLERLGLEQLDLYLLHWRGAVALDDTVRGMQALQRHGLIRHWGVSNFDVEDMAELVAVPGGETCAANQIYLSLSERGAGYALVPWLQQRGLLTMAYSPIDQGLLSGHAGLARLAEARGLTAAQLALAWSVAMAGTMAIPKAVKEAHLRDNLAAGQTHLDPSTLAELDRLFPPPRRKSPLAMT